MATPSEIFLAKVSHFMREVTGILRQKIVLTVNTKWQPIGIKMVRSAITDLTGGKTGNNPPAQAFVIEYEQGENGVYNFDSLINIRPVTWDEWLEQPIRAHDSVIHTPRREVRVPTVIMAVNMDKNPKIEKRFPSKRDIFERDDYTDQYDGRRYHPSELTIDHVISRAEWKRRGLPGSPDCWENLVACYAPRNHEKGDKSLKEAGLKLIRKPAAPPARRLTELIREIRHRDWMHFFEKTQERRVTLGEEVAVA